LSAPDQARPEAEALRARLTRAREDALLAEHQLDEAIHALVGQPRHKKVAVSKLVEAAMTRVRVVRAELALVEDLIAAAFTRDPA
jgi:hypothetical protein